MLPAKLMRLPSTLNEPASCASLGTGAAAKTARSVKNASADTTRTSLNCLACSEVRTT